MKSLYFRPPNWTPFFFWEEWRWISAAWWGNIFSNCAGISQAVFMWKTNEISWLWIANFNGKFWVRNRARRRKNFPDSGRYGCFRPKEGVSCSCFLGFGRLLYWYITKKICERIIVSKKTSSGRRRQNISPCSISDVSLILGIFYSIGDS